MRMKCTMCGGSGNRRPNKTTTDTWKVTSDISIEYQPAEPPFYCASCRAKPPPADLNCKGIKSKGGKCGHWLLHGTNYCSAHKHQGESK